METIHSNYFSDSFRPNRLVWQGPKAAENPPQAKSAPREETIKDLFDQFLKLQDQRIALGEKLAQRLMTRKPDKSSQGLLRTEFSPELLRTLGTKKPFSDNLSIKLGVAQNENTPDDVFRLFAADKSWANISVRLFVAQNLKTPDDVLRDLKTVKDPENPERAKEIREAAEDTWNRKHYSFNTQV